MNKKYNKLYLQSIKDRKEILKSEQLYDESLDLRLSDESFDKIIENYLTTYEVPMGLVPNILFEGAEHVALLATEEPSVIAGCSNAVNIINKNGGFKIEEIRRVMIGQIIFKNVFDYDALNQYIDNNKELFFKLAKEAHVSIHNLGGGLQDIRLETKESNFACLYLNVNCLDAMGANTINTILEKITSYIRENSPYEILMSILSNYATESTIKVSCIIDSNTLKNANVVNNIYLANLYAQIDKYRAVTHNKGVMNGVSALMLATGNDTRAIEAANHSFASRSGKYMPLTKWIVLENGALLGQIKLSLPLGVVGGSIGVLPKVKLAHKIMKITNANDLMKIAACVGLAQNFAALYALTTDGINKGHMKLHARSIALEVKCPENLIEELTEFLINSNNITIENAKVFLENLVNRK